VKIRNGFVSNSSSSSFILIAKTPVPNSKNYGKTFTRESSRNKTVHKDWEYIDVGDMYGEISYCRGDIMRINTIEEKTRYVMSLYAYYYQRDKDYFEKVLTLRDKISSLGKKRWYCINMSIPPLSARWAWDHDWSKEGDSRIPGTKKVETSVNIYTECNYVKELVDMCEDEDTTRLDSFLFNPQSFGILGGDEYEETDRLRAQCVPELTYEYERIADDPDYKKGDLQYIKSDGEKVYHDDDYSWEEDCVRMVSLFDSLSEEDKDGFMWDDPHSLDKEAEFTSAIKEMCEKFGKDNEDT